MAKARVWPRSFQSGQCLKRKSEHAEKGRTVCGRQEGMEEGLASQASPFGNSLNRQQAEEKSVPRSRQVWPAPEGSHIMFTS
jgi:hypothetical protein